jgi:hypothetical protein
MRGVAELAIWLVWHHLLESHIRGLAGSRPGRSRPVPNVVEAKAFAPRTSVVVTIAASEAL